MSQLNAEGIEVRFVIKRFRPKEELSKPSTGALASMIHQQEKGVLSKRIDSSERGAQGPSVVQIIAVVQARFCLRRSPLARDGRRRWGRDGPVTHPVLGSQCAHASVCFVLREGYEEQVDEDPGKHRRASSMRVRRRKSVDKQVTLKMGPLCTNKCLYLKEGSNDVNDMILLKSARMRRSCEEVGVEPNEIQSRPIEDFREASAEARSTESPLLPPHS